MRVFTSRLGRLLYENKMMKREETQLTLLLSSSFMMAGLRLVFYCDTNLPI